ncbi:MAG TPA: hypothetical protein VJM31_10430 [Vicinamibacterales bacterium]|nr:hypothetical protein [Vicinamibacterales bacterium]
MKTSIGDVDYQLPNLSRRLDAALREFYAFQNGVAPDNSRELDAAAIEYLTGIPQQWAGHDGYFNAFTPLWKQLISQERYDSGNSLWRRTLDPVNSVEQSGIRIHKGSAFYFWGMNEIMAGDVDLGFLLMHAALEEDIRTHGGLDPATPSYLLAVLDGDHPDQAFRPFVAGLSGRLDNRLEAYRRRYERNLTMPVFKRQFLQQRDLRETAFLLSFTLARLEKVLTNPVPVAGTFGSQFFANLFFDLCLVVDAAIKNRSTGVNDPDKFINLAAHLSSVSHLGLTTQDLGFINGQFKTNFEATLTGALDFTLTSRGRPMPQGASRLAVVYGLRNRGAHEPASSPTVSARPAEIAICLFDTLFLAVEVLY